jgi:hypothetical protein
MANSPAYQFYPADLISDPEVMFWDMEMLGAYWQMINYLWLNGGTFDTTSCDFFENLRKLFRKKSKKSAQSLWKKIEKKFVCQNGIITHKRVTKEMQKQADTRLKRQQAGKKGAEKKWANDGQATFLPLANDGFSSSSSTSTSLKENNKEKDIHQVFDSWNKYKGQSVTKDKKNITWHSHQLRNDRSISPEIAKAIRQTLSGGHSIVDIRGAIDNYAKVLLGEDYFWSYPWGLTEFLTRGEEKHKNAPRKWWKFLPDNFIEEHYLTEAAKLRRANQTRGPTPYQQAKEQTRTQETKKGNSQ